MLRLSGSFILHPRYFICWDFGGMTIQDLKCDVIDPKSHVSLLQPTCPIITQSIPRIPNPRNGCLSCLSTGFCISRSVKCEAFHVCIQIYQIRHSRSPSCLQIDTFGKWRRCLTNFCYLKLKKRKNMTHFAHFPRPGENSHHHH